MSKITKADIVDAIYNKTGTNRKEIRDIVDFFIDEVKAALVSHNVIELRGFGTFEIKIRKGRQKARNPKTGEILSVNSHGIAAFKAGRELRQDVWNLKLEEQNQMKKKDDEKKSKANTVLPPDKINEAKQ